MEPEGEVNHPVQSAEQYQTLSQDTLSKHFFHERVNPTKLARLNYRLKENGADLDDIKRLLFYPKPKRESHIVPDKSSKILSDLTEEQQVMLHGAMGMVTEAVELYETVLEHILGNEELDFTNIKIELGDSEWYAAALRELFGWSQLEIQQGNYNKLTARNKGRKFDAEGTANRNEEQERGVV